ncbi:MAG: hypothetical protein RI922_2418 [Bacteroidota bacterium]|jgi:hypothetical protein
MRNPTQVLVKILTLKFEITRMNRFLNPTHSYENTLYICVTFILIYDL